MQDVVFDAVFHGKTLDGADLEQARQNFAALFKLDDSHLSAIFDRLPVVLKKGLDKSQAKQLQAQMARAGYRISFRQVKQEAEPAPAWSLEPIENADSTGNAELSDPTVTSEVKLSLAESDIGKKSACESAQPDEHGGQVWGNAQKVANLTPKPQQSAEINRTVQCADADTSNPRYVDVEFLGSGREYFRIWIVNILLTIITLGIYSAWAKVRNNQYFYGNTHIDGSSFEYLADPIVILKGRLIAVAVLVVYFVLQQLNPLLGALLPLLLLPLVPWIVVRSLAFNARNSAYRNLRFNFEASWVEALKAFTLWPLAGSLTLGLLMPYALHKQKCFMLNHSSYGTSAFQFEAKASIWYWFFLKLIGVVIVAVLLVMMIPHLGLVILPLLYLGAHVAYKVFEGNLIFNMSRLNSIRFHSELKLVPMAWIYASNTVATLLSLGLFIPWAKVRMARYRASCLQMELVRNLDQFVAEEQRRVTALGTEIGDVFDMEFSVI